MTGDIPYLIMTRLMGIFICAAALGLSATTAAPGQGDQGLFPPAYRGETVPYVDARQGTRLYPVNINNWWGHINRQGYLVVYPRFDWADYSYQGYARVVIDGRTGYLSLSDDIDVGGAFLEEERFFRDETAFYITRSFRYADRFKNDYAVVGDGEHFGIINRAGDLIVPIRLDGALRFRDGYAAVQRGDRVGFINQAGDLAIDLRFAKARSFHQGLAAVRAMSGGEAGAWGYINKSGDWRFRDTGGRIQTLGDFHENLARVEIAGRWGYMNRQFNLAFEPRFQGARDFRGGLAAVKVDGRWGYINKTGQFRIAPAFRDAGDFGSDRSGERPLAVIAADLEYGYVNQTGKGGIEPQFDWARPFFRGLARVPQPPNFGYIDIAGNVAWDPRAPLAGVRDLTLTGQAAAALSDRRLGTRRIVLPPKRPPRPAPYPPDHEYEPVLPKSLR